MYICIYVYIHTYTYIQYTHTYTYYVCSLRICQAGQRLGWLRGPRITFDNNNIKFNINVNNNIIISSSSSSRITLNYNSSNRTTFLELNIYACTYITYVYRKQAYVL